MNIGAVDHSATLGTSWLHRASPVAKLAAFALTLAAVVLTWNALVVASLAIMLASVATSCRLKFRLTYSLALYPGLFALVFAVSSAPDALVGAVIVLKAVTAALAAVIIVLTTPYPQVFAPVQRIVPSIVGDALLMTYRSTFLLLEKFSNLLRAVRLRSGLTAGHPVRAARATTSALGGLLLYSFDLSQRDYDVMRLRGYEGRLRAPLPRGESPARDVALVAGAALALATSALWRAGAATLNPYSWLVAIPALLALGVALIATRRNR
ncbi:MAG: energy-coupling factor transporter transmembrane component T [Actinomycetota bacterium]|nr:energy-coupling factor transporter transmembrane component T [Actinomycetota bacterium]